MAIQNPLEDEAVVFDIIEEYNATLKQLEEVNALLEDYKGNDLKNKEIEDIYRNSIEGPPEKQEDVLKDDESLDF